MSRVELFWGSGGGGGRRDERRRPATGGPERPGRIEGRLDRDVGRCVLGPGGREPPGGRDPPGGKLPPEPPGGREGLTRRPFGADRATLARGLRRPCRRRVCALCAPIRHLLEAGAWLRPSR